MLAKRVAELPEGDSWIFEPKWDGFRTLIFRDGGELLIQSRDEKSLNRYFPELIETLLAQLPKRCVLDGEIVIANKRGLDFDALQLRGGLRCVAWRRRRVFQFCVANWQPTQNREPIRVLRFAKAALDLSYIERRIEIGAQILLVLLEQMPESLPERDAPQ